MNPPTIREQWQNEAEQIFPQFTSELERLKQQHGGEYGKIYRRPNQTEIRIESGYPGVMVAIEKAKEINIGARESAFRVMHGVVAPGSIAGYESALSFVKRKEYDSNWKGNDVNVCVHASLPLGKGPDIRSQYAFYDNNDGSLLHTTWVINRQEQQGKDPNPSTVEFPPEITVEWLKDFFNSHLKAAVDFYSNFSQRAAILAKNNS